MAVKTSISSMVIGDKISFYYTATANSFGTISQLGTSTAPVIPMNSSAIPNGTAYFIFTGYDHLGRMKLVADRVIQHSISYDSLNAAGVASGSGLPISIDGKDGYTIRLLTGGINTSDKDNEWDKIIVESTLNSIIAAGDNALWNWSSLGTITSTLVTGSMAILRGVSTVYNMSNSGLATTNTSSGFRPVLLAEVKDTLFLVLKDNKAYSSIDGALTEVAANFNALTNAEKQALFTSSEFPSLSSLKDFVNFSTLAFSENDISSKVLINAVPFKTTLPDAYSPRITAVPQTQFVHASGDINLKGYGNIDWFHVNDGITGFESGSGKVRHLASRDKGITYWTHNGTDWAQILDTTNAADGAFVSGRFVPTTAAMARIMSQGMTKAQFDAAPWQAWTIDLGYSDIRFGYALNIESAADTAFCDNLKLQYDGQGEWKQAVNGVDYEARFSNDVLKIKWLTGGYRAKVNY